MNRIQRRLRHEGRKIRSVVAKQRDALEAFIVCSVVGSQLWSRSARPRLLRWCGAHVGNRCGLGANVEIFRVRNITIGDGCYVNSSCLFDAWAPITLGSRVNLGWRVLLVTSTHEPGSAHKRAGDLVSMPITIGDGAWIGAGATILAGVTIGAGTVIAAGSVVTSDCLPNKLYAGVPAVCKRDLT